MNQQEIFDKVASHLITQGVKSTYVFSDGGYPRCAYRGDNGTMCAAGCLIPDEEYDQGFEGCSWFVIQEKIPSLASLTSKEHKLIISLQDLHDSYVDWDSMNSLKIELRDVAFKYELSSDILN